MSRVLMENFTSDELTALYGEGKKFSILVQDDGDLFFRTTIAQLEMPVEKAKGFRIAEDHSVSFKDYSDIVIDTAKRRHIKVGTKGNADRFARGKERIITSTEFDAYAAEFGIDNLRLKSEISIPIIEE